MVKSRAASEFNALEACRCYEAMEVVGLGVAAHWTFKIRLHDYGIFAYPVAKNLESKRRGKDYATIEIRDSRAFSKHLFFSYSALTVLVFHVRGSHAGRVIEDNGLC